MGGLFHDPETIMLTVLAVLAGIAFATGKIGEKQGRTPDEKLGAIPFYLAACVLAIAAAVSLAF